VGETEPKPTALPQPICIDCGVVESVTAVEQEGEGTGLGAVAGGVLGGVLGHQIGKGTGNTVATIAGAAGGAYAGHQVEKKVKKTKRFDIVVRMDDGSTRSFQRDTDPGLARGQKVRVEDGNIVPR
jgi:outer membrane lipoprotein SlyB